MVEEAWLEELAKAGSIPPREVAHWRAPPKSDVVPHPNPDEVVTFYARGQGHGAPVRLRKRSRLTPCPLSILLQIACTHVYWCSPGRQSSPIHVAEVLYKHVGGGDVKLMMKVRPATTPRRHQARLLAGDDDAAKTLKRGAMRPVLRDEAGTKPPPPTSL